MAIDDFVDYDPTRETIEDLVEVIGRTAKRQDKTTWEFSVLLTLKNLHTHTACELFCETFCGVKVPLEDTEHYYRAGAFVLETTSMFSTDYTVVCTLFKQKDLPVESSSSETSETSPQEASTSSGQTTPSRV